MLQMLKGRLVCPILDRLKELKKLLRRYRYVQTSVKEDWLVVYVHWAPYPKFAFHVFEEECSFADGFQLIHPINSKYIIKIYYFI